MLRLTIASGQPPCSTDRLDDAGYLLRAAGMKGDVAPAAASRRSSAARQKRSGLQSRHGGDWPRSLHIGRQRRRPAGGGAVVKKRQIRRILAQEGGEPS
jgi:hypothetical protein